MKSFANYKQTTIDAYNQIARTYKRQNFENNFWKEQFEKLQNEMSKIKLKQHNSTFLDLGCGTGRDYALATTAGMKYIGIDLSKKMLAIARQTHKQGDFREMDITKLNLDDNEFDIVWASAVLLHLDSTDLQKALEEIKRVMKDTGLLYVAMEMRQKGQDYKEMKTSIKDGSRIKRFFARYDGEDFTNILVDLDFVVLMKGQKGEENGEKTWLWYIASLTESQ